MVYKVDRAKNDVVMDMPLVNVRRKDVFMLPLCYRVGKLPPDLMGFFVIDFPRLKRLYQVVGEVISLIQRLRQGIQASFAPFYTETILNETITPSDIRTVEAQVDQYNFLDIDDIEEFNGYLYQDKRTSKEKARMWALLDKSLQIINRHPELEKLEIRATIKRFLRFYSFLIQATCFESVDLHKKYNFLSYLVKEIEVGSGGNDFDIADKITASNFRQKKTGENTHEIESKPEVSLPTPNEVFMDEAVKKKLSEIIDEINAAYNKNFDVDVASKSALQMRDILLKNGHLRDSARNNSLKDFRFAYFDAVQDALIAGYEQNQDFFALLLDNDEKKRELMQVFLEDVYKNLRG